MDVQRGFKALKQATKLLYLTLQRPIEALQTYTQLLTYTKSAVTRNYSEKTINNILDYVGGAKGGYVDVDVLERFYQATNGALEEAKNEVLSRLGLITGIAGLTLSEFRDYLPRQILSWRSCGLTGRSTVDLPRYLLLVYLLTTSIDVFSTHQLIKELHHDTQESDDIQSRGTQLLEIYALEIQMYNETKNHKKLKVVYRGSYCLILFRLLYAKEIYNATNEVRSAIPHPRIMGVIKECGGKMWMGERECQRVGRMQ